MLERFWTRALLELDHEPDGMTWRALCLFVLIGYAVGLVAFGCVFTWVRLMGWPPSP